jgi:hypothetical protein
VALSLLLVSSAHAGATVLVGPHRLSELGIIELSTDDGRVAGRVRGGGSCQFPADLQVLTGAMEGNVFVGTVLVCQDGPGCEKEKTYPFLALVASDGMSGEVKLDTGCRSPALDGKRLRAVPATKEDLQRLERESGLSAAQLAQKNGANKQKLQEEAKKLFADAYRTMQEGNLAKAATLAQASLARDSSVHKAWTMLGVLHINLKNPSAAAADFEEALKAARASKANDLELQDIYYNLACARTKLEQRREAIEALKVAFSYPGATTLADRARQDPDVNDLRDEPEFKKLLIESANRPDKTRKPK